MVSPHCHFDVLVLGGGPAGMVSAITASQNGLRVGLIDEQAEAGGQIWRAPWASSPQGYESPEARDGNKMRDRLALSSVTCLFGRRIWSVTDRYRVDLLGADGVEIFQAPHLIVALGAHERVIPFPGWTLPGVMGLAAATIMLKAHGLAPPKDWVLAGVGPLLAAVAAGYARKGHPPKAIIDLSGPSDWFAALPSLASRPGLFKQGVGWVLSIVSSRIPIYFRHAIRRAEGQDRISACVIGPVDADGKSIDGPEVGIACNAMMVGNGLVPGGEVPRLLGADQVYRHELGGWIPECDPFGRTSLEHLYAIGDGAGIRGGAVACSAGKLAGLAAAHDAGRIDAGAFAHQSAQALAEHRKLSAFSDAMAHMIRLRPAQVASIEADAVICRCEDVTRQDLVAAARAGARDVNQLKHFTRCGMGPCQGRMCGDVAAEILAQEHRLDRQAVGYWTARPPLRPISLQSMLGRFDYADIPIPKPAPL